MYEYDGINSDIFMLLAENRFRNSKEFYEQHKEEIKQKAIVPMRQLAGIIGQDLVRLDEKMNVNPVKMVSRIRRDTRFSRDKSLYREHVWVMFMRPKNENNIFPFMWFEVQPGCYSYGIGNYTNKPGFMEYYRRAIAENSDDFLNAVKTAKRIGARPIDIKYKREKGSNIPDKLKEYYNSKEFYLIKESNKIENLKDDTIIKELKRAYKAFAPLYKFLMSVSEKYISENLND